MNEIRYGTVSHIFHNEGRVKVEFEDLNISSAILTVFQGRNQGVKQYSMPKINEKGLCLIAATGNSGYYLGSGYNMQDPVMKEAGEGRYITLYPDGTKMMFDENTSKLYIDCKKNIEIICPQISITGDISIKGSITVEGGITATEDVQADGVSLINHKTTGVKAGGDVSGPPQK